MNRQEKIREQRKTECIQAKCSFRKRCYVLNGRDCIKLEGKKIPLMGIGEVRGFPEQSTHKMRPFWIEDGWVMNDERDY